MSTTTVSLRPPFAVQWTKSGRIITLGKVYERPDGSLAFRTPYAMPTGRSARQVSRRPSTGSSSTLA
jgi:hypothetical protein